MSLIVSSTGNSSFEPVPAGSHLARCVQIIDLGTQTWEYQGAPKIGGKVMLTFELPNVTYEKDGVAQARMISREFTASFGEKSNLRKMLESWRGRTFTADEVKAFDISKLAGAPCMLSVIHSTKGDKTFANINGIIQVPTGVTVPERVHPTIVYDIADLDKSEVFGQIPEWIQNKIKESEEFKNHGASKAVDNAPSLAEKAEAAVAGQDDWDGPF